MALRLTWLGSAVPGVARPKNAAAILHHMSSESSCFSEIYFGPKFKVLFMPFISFLIFLFKFIDLANLIL